MNLGGLVRFFLLVNPSRNAVVFGLLVAGGIAGDLAASMDRGAILACILFLQMFACSTGYVSHGGRGHYDPALTSGAPRWCIGSAHLFASAGPGVLAWILFGAWSAIRGGEESGLAFRPASIAFLLMVSVISWALTLRLPPMSGGILWTLLSVATVVSAEFVRILVTSIRDPESIGRDPWRALATGLLVPIFSYAASWPGPFVAAFLAIALIALALGLLFITKRDLPLAEEE